MFCLPKTAWPPTCLLARPHAQGSGALLRVFFFFWSWEVRGTPRSLGGMPGNYRALYIPETSSGSSVRDRRSSSFALSRCPCAVSWLG